MNLFRASPPLTHDYYVDDVHDSSNFNVEMNPYFCDERLLSVVLSTDLVDLSYHLTL
mgnify:CR=1 FL=1